VGGPLDDFQSSMGQPGSSRRMNESTFIVSTDRCLLRHATSSDYEALVTAISASEFPGELPLAGLYRQGKLKGWLDSIIEMQVNGKACLLSIDLRTGEKCVGQVSLVRRDQSGSWNLAFWLHPSHWRKGLALETASAVVEHAFTVMCVEEVWAGAALWNHRSIEMLLKLGLVPLQDTGVKDEKPESDNAFRAFSVLRDHWIAHASQRRNENKSSRKMTQDGIAYFELNGIKHENMVMVARD
jgi:RimJ/RimL family protein N-acetyltransferase